MPNIYIVIIIFLIMKDVDHHALFLLCEFYLSI